MLISGFSINKGKEKCFSYMVKPSTIVSLLLIGSFSVNLWHILTSSGLELSGGKDIYSFLDSVKLDGQNINYEYVFMKFR